MPAATERFDEQYAGSQTAPENIDGRFIDIAPDISGPAGGHGMLAAQYVKLEKALVLCAKAKLGTEPALKSASWGMGQVMGFNFALAGYKRASRMVQSMVLSEDAQLAAMAGFLKANGLAEKLVKKDWTGFAKIYNGSTYWQNQYGVKLAEQYQRFASGSVPNLEIGSAQVALLFLGYAPSKVDGMIGPRTRAAMKNFRIAAGLPAVQGSRRANLSNALSKGRDSAISHCSFEPRSASLISLASSPYEC